MRPLRIALLAHSTNPRGGVVHALELGDALTRLGHEAVVHAPDVAGGGFFRAAECETTCVPATPCGADVFEMVEARVADYLRYFNNPANRRFDVFHAQDGISGNALAVLKQRGVIARAARTVHHIDHFEDPRLNRLQARAIESADQIFVVSQLWHAHLRQDFGAQSTLVGNGVDCTRFSPALDGREPELRRRYQLGQGPVFLAIGGVEERKNTLRLLQAFRHLHQTQPSAQLLIAGGASLLNHGSYQAAFAAGLAACDLPANSVILTGPIPQADMPALYRVADTLVFPSVKEGFGLVVMEAMASGVPVVVSQIAPFTEYLKEREVAWCDPLEPASIAAAMLATLHQTARGKWIVAGFMLAAKHSWQNTAQAHLPVYETMREALYA